MHRLDGDSAVIPVSWRPDGNYYLTGRLRVVDGLADCDCLCAGGLPLGSHLLPGPLAVVFLACLSTVLRIAVRGRYRRKGAACEVGDAAAVHHRLYFPMRARGPSFFHYPLSTESTSGRAGICSASNIHEHGLKGKLRAHVVDLYGSRSSVSCCDHLRNVQTG